MIFKIFEKSKPINLLIAITIIIIGFVSSSFLSGFNWNVNNIMALIVAISSVFIVDFISKKNKLSNQSSFVILFYALFFNIYWATTSEHIVLYTHLFTLLAFRKIISLKSSKNTAQKIFDAALWISIATLFSFWNILYFILLFAAIIMYASENIKHYLIPLISIFTIYIIINSFSLYSNHSLYHFLDMDITFDFSPISSTKNKCVLAFFIFTIIGLFILIDKNIKHLTKKNKTSYLLISLALLMAIIIFIIKPKMETTVFIFFPISVLLSAVFEQIAKKSIQTLILFSIITGAILLYFM